MATGPLLAFGQLTFPLNKVTNSVGRKDRITNQVPDVDLGTLDQDRSVSRRHAELAYEKGTTSLRDIGSTNGTTVNGERLAHQVDRALEDGDRVGFGGVEMVFVAQGEWPEGVEAEWPPEVPEAMAEETMIAGPTGTEETMISPPSDFASGETMVYAPIGDDPAPMPEPEPEHEEAVAAPVAEAYVACSNHSHLPAVGVCPGCLEAFCVDCLPEREDGLMVCNRCAGISYRLGAAGAAAEPATVGAPATAMPQPAPPPADGSEKKKKWPF